MHLGAEHLLLQAAFLGLADSCAQQRIADTYYAAKLIPKPLKVSAITVWTPKP